jgi:hypothetical protein
VAYDGKGIYAEMWLIVAEGGWWTAKEIFDALPEEYRKRGRISDHLWAMTYRCNLLVARGTRGAAAERQYAVTSECFVPTGVNVARLSAAMMGKSTCSIPRGSDIISLPVTKRGEVHDATGTPSLGNNVALLQPGRRRPSKRAA